MPKSVRLAHFLIVSKKANNVTSTCVNCFWYFIWLINFFLWGKWLDIKVFVCLFGGFFFGFALKISPFSKAIRNEMKWTQPIVVFNAFRKVSYIWNDPPSMKPTQTPTPTHPCIAWMQAYGGRKEKHNWSTMTAISRSHNWTFRYKRELHGDRVFGVIIKAVG